MEGVDKGILRIIFDKEGQGNYDILVPVPILEHGFNTMFPVYEPFTYVLFFSISRNGNDLTFTRGIYTAHPKGIQIKNVYLIK